MLHLFPQWLQPPDNDLKLRDYRFFPQGEGREYQNTKTLEPLNAYRDDVTILGGLSHPRSRQLLGHIAGDTFLTAGDLRGSYKNNISVDQVAARELGQQTRYPSFVLSLDGGVGYKSRTASMSYDQLGNSIPAEHRHREIFERYFSPTGGGTTEARQKELQRGQKIVDLVLANSKDFKRKLGKNDQEKMDQYLTSLNSVETQLKKNEAWLNVPMPEMDASRLSFDADPTKSPETYIRSMFDLMVLGFQLDLTRVVTYQIGREDGMGFGENFAKLAIGAKKGHHGLSHSGDYKTWSTYDNWLCQQLAYFLGQLKTVSDEHGPLLDHTQVLYGSACSTTHNAVNLPLVLAGGKKLGLQHGSYSTFTEKTPMSNLFVSMLNAAGIKRERFADSTGSLPGELFS